MNGHCAEEAPHLAHSRARGLCLYTRRRRRMMAMELIGADKLGRNLSRAEREVFPHAAARAINSTATTVRAESIRAIAKRIGVRQRDVRGKTRIKRATPKLLTAVITFSGRGFNLIRFRARQTARGVSAAPGGRRQIFPQTFIVDLGTGKFVGVRQRKGAGYRHERAESYEPARRVGRIPVIGVVGPGVASTAAEPEMAKMRRETVARVLPGRLKRELRFYMARARR